jgi:hypothetical protein
MDQMRQTSCCKQGKPVLTDTDPIMTAEITNTFSWQNQGRSSSSKRQGKKIQHNADWGAKSASFRLNIAGAAGVLPGVHSLLNKSPNAKASSP